jgi:hypothetical protein
MPELLSFWLFRRTFFSRGGGTRTHTVRILSPLPLPIGLRPHVVREYTSQVWPSSTVQQASSG